MEAHASRREVFVRNSPWCGTTDGLSGLSGCPVQAEPASVSLLPPVVSIGSIAPLLGDGVSQLPRGDGVSQPPRGVEIQLTADALQRISRVGFSAFSPLRCERRVLKY